MIASQPKTLPIVSPGDVESPTLVDGTHARFHLLTGLMALVIGFITLIMFRRDDVGVENFPLDRLLFECTFISLAAMYCHWCGYVKLREGCLLVVWACLLWPILPLASYFVARHAMPLQDALLLKVDKILGVNVGAIVVWTRFHDKVNVLVMGCYALMFPLVALASVVPALAGRLSSARIFIVSAIVGAAIANILLGLFPAIGPWDSYHFQPNVKQELSEEHLRALRTASHFVFNPGTDTGLVAFPSIHVALSLMAARGLWWLRWIRPITGLACVLIAIATMATGWYYAADVVGGLGLAVVSGWLAEKGLGVSAEWM